MAAPIPICRLHRRMYTANPAQEPETFFEVLCIKRLCPTIRQRGSPTNRAHSKVKDLILSKWSEKRLHLVGAP